ncbi:MAG: AtpZ/AtpI family protein [Eubacteriales bacterium]|nr:AtpZ/AtpI family protein [Eubacteriales bacterium]
MNGKGDMYRNIVLISQVSINVMVPTFICLAAGIWLDKRFGTWFTIPLLFLGMAAGARNAYVLVSNTIRQEERRRQRKLQAEIDAKVKKAGQKKIDDELKKGLSGKK